ncbi:MAG: sensor histidine kinase [Nocardioides sp.]
MRGTVRAWSEGQVAGLPVPDLVVGALLLLVGVGTTLEVRPPEGPLALTVPVAVVMAVATIWRRRAPLAVVVVVTLAGEVQAALADSPGTVYSFAVLLLVDYSVARFCSEGRAAVGGGVLLAGLWLQEWQDQGSDYLFFTVVFGGLWLLGRAVRRWQERAALAELNAELVAQHAVAEERVRIARELHDVVAHALSVISVQANAAEAALERQPALAREPVAAIKLSAREALDEMRRMLALLRTDEDEDSARPGVGLSELDSLLESVRAAGLPVRTVVRGTARPLPAGVDRSAFRIIQEALTNVLKHAGPAATQVEVDYAPSQVRLSVVNDQPSRPPATASGGGHGLIGIRERAHACGGTVTTGPRSGGGFAVHAVLPLGEGA